MNIDDMTPVELARTVEYNLWTIRQHIWLVAKLLFISIQSIFIGFIHPVLGLISFFLIFMIYQRYDENIKSDFQTKHMIVWRFNCKTTYFNKTISEIKKIESGVKDG